MRDQQAKTPEENMIVKAKGFRWIVNCEIKTLFVLTKMLKLIFAQEKMHSRMVVFSNRHSQAGVSIFS